MNVMFVLVVASLLSIAISAVLVLGTFRTFQVQNAPGQKLFLKGTVPEKMPDGLYKGYVRNIKTSWQGKSFNSKNSTGINIFKDGSANIKKYPFKTYVGNGIQDKNLEVIKIDYNLKENPLWLKFILDEVVEVKKGKLLGKLHLRILPGLAFSLGYFNLEQ